MVDACFRQRESRYAQFIDKLARLNIVHCPNLMAHPQAAKQNQNEIAMRSPSGADLVLLLLLIMAGFGIWAVVERGLTAALRSWEPNEQRIMDAHSVTKEKAELTDLNNEIAEVQKYLNTARLEQVKQNAAVNSFVEIYPGLAGTPSPPNYQPDVERAFAEARRQREAANNVVKSLEERLASLKTKATTIGAELDAHQQAAESELRWTNGRYVVLKRGGTFLATLAIVLGLMWLVRGVLWWLAKKRRMSTTEGFRPFVLALGALVVLFAYDQFSYAGAALISILLLLLLLRRINWPKKSELKLLK